MFLRRSQRRPEHLLRRLPPLAAHQRRGPDAQFRKGVGLVLLDLDHGRCGPVELEDGDASGDFAEEDVD